MTPRRSDWQARGLPKNAYPGSHCETEAGGVDWHKTGALPNTEAAGTPKAMVSGSDCEIGVLPNAGAAERLEPKGPGDVTRWSNRSEANGVDLCTVATISVACTNNSNKCKIFSLRVD